MKKVKPILFTVFDSLKFVEVCVSSRSCSSCWFEFWFREFRFWLPIISSILEVHSSTWSWSCLVSWCKFSFSSWSLALICFWIINSSSKYISLRSTIPFQSSVGLLSAEIKFLPRNTLKLTKKQNPVTFDIITQVLTEVVTQIVSSDKKRLHLLNELQHW